MIQSRGYDLVVVGAGFAGAVVAERAARRLGWRVLVVEQRSHIAGNAFDSVNEYGVLVHRYGPHIFHTNSDVVWRYLSRFTSWLPYRHKVMASLSAGLVPLPFNFNSIDRVFSNAHAGRLKKDLIAAYGSGADVSILQLRESACTSIRRLANLLYEEVYLGYTLKHWGRRPEEMDSSVTARVPLRLGRNNAYFTDRYQGIPAEGYTSLIGRILSHPKIDLALGIDYHAEAKNFRGRRLVYTGPIDRYFGYRYGELPYRTLRIEFKHDTRAAIQPVGVINYPNHEAYTRSTEYKHFTGQNVEGTTISFEYPGPHRQGETTPYYPMPLPESRVRYRRYAEAARLCGSVVFCGRLGRYQYLNMDQAVGQALATMNRVATLL